nr:integrase, catalytic region, zinc finger, CCHC-type, peptidase aspartic, catalytic [Tanacetum cinerariifolium]
SLEGVDLLKGYRSTNLYTINVHEMTSASPIYLMARASSTKSWLWNQRLSHLNFDTINDLARNDLVAGLLKFKYHKEHLSPSCEQGKKQTSIPSTKASSKFEAAITSSSYGFVWTNVNCQYQWITVLLQSPVIIIRTDNGTEFKNQVLKVYFDSVGISYQIIYNRQTKKIMETMNVSFDELSAMAFEQHSSKPGLQCMTSRQISSGLDLTYAPSTITKQQPTEGELDLLFEAMYDDYFGGQLSATMENVLTIQEPQVRQTSTASTKIADNVPIPTNSSSHATNI